MCIGIIGCTILIIIIVVAIVVSGGGDEEYPYKVVAANLNLNNTIFENDQFSMIKKSLITDEADESIEIGWSMGFGCSGYASNENTMPLR